MDDLTGNKTRKALVTVVLEQTLLEMGKPAYDEVVHMLYHNYSCSLDDCYEHPGYLKQVLETLYGKSHVTIIESLKRHLGEYEDQKEIRDFIKNISA